MIERDDRFSHDVDHGVGPFDLTISVHFSWNLIDWTDPREVDWLLNYILAQPVQLSAGTFGDLIGEADVVGVPVQDIRSAAEERAKCIRENSETNP